MSLDKAKLIKLNDLVSLHFRRKHIIVLNPEEKQESIKELNGNIEYDKSEWKLPEKFQTAVTEISENSQLSNEEKILSIFEQLCRNYVYDDNLISYIQKIDDESYDLPDWYGRDVDENWERNREEHNRRVCYEVSRYLAKAIQELFKDKDDVNVCILWDKGNTHYFVGLTCDEYSITLDSDNFNNIKDLTRIKAELTAQGIVILDDKKGKFTSALNKFNQDRSDDAIKKIENEIDYNNTFNQNTENQTSDKNEEPENITFLKNAIEILKEKYNIDSQGIFEYMKEIVDIRLGPESRKKVWKKIEGKDNKATRYIRCLVLKVDNQEYILDVDKMLIRTFDEEEFGREDTDFIPYKDLSRDWGEPYDGTWLIAKVNSSLKYKTKC